MDLGDIDKTSPAIIKQNKVTNIIDYKLKSEDIDSPNRNKFKSQPRDPLNPVYNLETKSRRHVLQIGDIDGNKPKIVKSNVTRRIANRIDDIDGTKAKPKGYAPESYLKGLPSLKERIANSNNAHRKPSFP